MPEEKVIISDDRKMLIEEKAKSVLRENGLDVPGFDLAKFLSESQGFVIGLQEMDDDTTGVLLMNDHEYVAGTQSHKLIAINTKLKEAPNFSQRKRFIAAHEYAHSLLHKQGESIYAHRDTSNKNTMIEQEADYFARCLLMPRSWIDSFMNVESIHALSYPAKKELFARIFNVTPSKSDERLKELGYCGT